MLKLRQLSCQIVLAVLVLFGSAQAWAQAQPAPSEAPSESETPAGDAPVEALIRALEDPEARARLLRALREPAQEPPPAENSDAAQEQAEAGAPFETAAPVHGPPVAPEPPAPEPTVITKALDNLRTTLSNLAKFAQNAADVSTLWRWLKLQYNTAETRAFWGDFLTALILTLGIASAGYWLVRLGLSRVHRRLREAVRTASRRVRIRRGVILALLELAPIATFWAIAQALAGSLYFPLRTELVTAALVTIVGDALLFVGLSRILLRPHTPYLRAFTINDEAARDLYRTLRWLILWSLLGYGLFSNISSLRVPPGVFEGLERIWGLVILGTVLIALLRYRSKIGEAIAGNGGKLSLFRRFLAQIWLPAIILYGIGAYLIWALDVYQGAELLVRGGILSVLILLAVQPISMVLNRWLHSMQAAEVTGPTAILQSRLERYATLLQILLSFLIYALAVIGIGYAWGMDPLGWMEAHLSGRFMVVLGDIAFVLLVCWGLWEVFDLWFTLYLGSVDETGARVQRSARSRTLLPLLRTSVLILLMLAFLVAVLTSFGLDVAPLLATAGVVGIAIGFGAQKLVQDVITGLFMLFQDTISIGDVVSLGGFTGTVERITVRTLELRDLEGSLHTIPFSAVNTVTNMSREFAHAMVDIGVAYKEDTDVVIDVLRQVGAEFELDPEHGPHLLSALEVFGVQQLGDNGVTIRCRFQVRPLTQWSVRRAFLARVKHRFDELGIEIPFPQRTLHWGGKSEDQAGSLDVSQVAEANE